MRKYLLPVFILLTLPVFLFGTWGAPIVFGVSGPIGGTPVTIRGNLNSVIPGPKLVALGNQKVTVVCGSVTKTATTDVHGLYTVTFTEPGCAPLSQASTKGNYNSSIITRQVSVSSEGRATIDLIF